MADARRLRIGGLLFGFVTTAAEPLEGERLRAVAQIGAMVTDFGRP